MEITICVSETCRRADDCGRHERNVPEHLVSEFQSYADFDDPFGGVCNKYLEKGWV